MKLPRVPGPHSPAGTRERSTITDAPGIGLERKTNLLGDTMMILSDALTRTEEAHIAATDLRRRLSEVRAELLALERLGAAPHGDQVVADRAGEMARQLRGPLHAIPSAIRAALDSTESAYFDGTASGEIDDAHARTMIGVVLQCAREVSHLQFAINDTAAALRDDLTDPSGDCRMPRPKLRSLQRTSTSLERAQHGAYRAIEDLWTITRSLSVDVAGLVGDRVEAGATLRHGARSASGAELVRPGVVSVEELRCGLDTDHAELAEIESLVRQHGSSLVVVDRAEDLRRSLRYQRLQQAQGVRRTLRQAETLLLEKASNGQADPATARSMTSVALQASKEVRHLHLDLVHCANSLTRLAQSSPTGQPTGEASNGIKAATTGIGRARRSALRLSEDLPVIARSVGPRHDRPVALSLVLSEEMEQLAPAQTGPPSARAVGPVPSVSHGARPVGFDR